MHALGIEARVYESAHGRRHMTTPAGNNYVCGGRLTLDAREVYTFHRDERVAATLNCVRCFAAFQKELDKA